MVVWNALGEETKRKRRERREMIERRYGVEFWGNVEGRMGEKGDGSEARDQRERVECVVP